MMSVVSSNGTPQGGDLLVLSRVPELPVVRLVRVGVPAEELRFLLGWQEHNRDR